MGCGASLEPDEPPSSDAPTSSGAIKEMSSDAPTSSGAIKEMPHCGSGKALSSEFFTCREVPEAEGDAEAEIAYPAYGQAFPDKDDQDLFPPVEWTNVPVVDALSGAPAWAERFDAVVKKYLTDNKMPGGCQLAISKAGKGIVYNRAFGVASMTDPSATRLTTDNLLYFGSISKTVTCIAAMLLVERGSLQLDALVVEILGGGTYLPEPSDGVACQAYGIDAHDNRVGQITIKMLMNHTSGMTDGGGMGSQAFDTSTAEKACKMLLSKPFELAHDPGEKHDYTNFGANILARIIEVVSGENYEAFVQSNIWSKLGCDENPVVSSMYKPHKGEVPCYTVTRPGTLGEDKSNLKWKYMWGGRSLAQGNKEIGMEGAGGWKGSAQDLARLGADMSAGLTGPDGSSKILGKQATFKVMMGSGNSHPDAMGDPATSWYSLGWIGWAQDASKRREDSSDADWADGVGPMLMHGGTFGSDLNLCCNDMSFAFILSAQPHFEQYTMDHVSPKETGLKTALRTLMITMKFSEGVEF